MCELATAELGSHAMQAHDREQWISLLRRDVELAVQAAVRNPVVWRKTLPWMRDGKDAKLAQLAIDGDYCEAGRMLFAYWRAEIMRDAKDAEQDRIYQRYGIDLDEVTP